MRVEELYKIMGMTFINSPLSQQLAEGNDKLSLALQKVKRTFQNCKGAIENGVNLEEAKYHEKLEASFNEYVYNLSVHENSLKVLVGEDNFREYGEKVISAKKDFSLSFWALKTYASEMESKGLLNYAKAQEKETELELEEDSSEKSVLSVKSNPAAAGKAKSPFEDIYNKLKSLNTFSSSGEYKGIIDMVEFAKDYENWESGKDLTREQRFISKCIAIKSCINKYINHKATAGVKQNAFKKLAAVEELNRMVEHYLEIADFNPFRYGETYVRRENYPLSYEDEVKRAKFRKFRDSKYKAYTPISEEEAEVQKKVVEDKYPNADAQEIMHADGCMARIILSALNHHKVENVAVDRLINMQKEFLDNPANEKVAAPVRAEAAIKL